MNNRPISAAVNPFISPARTLLSVVSAGVLLASGAASIQAQSALDGFDPKANGVIRAVAVQPDGKILIGGEFTTLAPNGGATVTRNRLARLNADGTLDGAFTPNANAAVDAIVVQPDGKILVGGQFTMIGGQPRNHIARLDAVTADADAFDPNANGFVRTVALQPDGKVLAGGLFTTIGGQTRNYIARLNAAFGAADVSFNPSANDVVRVITLQADGKVLAGGQFTAIGGQPRNYLARLNASSGTADSFNPNPNEVVRALAVQADGKIVAGGVFTSVTPNGGSVVTRNHIARFDATTGAPDSFNPNANGDVLALAVQPDGNILAGGDFSGADSIGGQTRNFVARLSSTTGMADSFDPNANDTVRAIAVQPDRKIVIGGVFTTVAPNGGTAVTRNRVARLEIDGRLDRTLDVNLLGTSVYATALQADGKILIGGFFTSVLGVPRDYIARLNTDGTLDTTFDPDAGAQVNTIAVQADGKILVGGAFTRIGGQTRNRIARLDPVTGLADSFNPNAGDEVLAITVEASGKILVGGKFKHSGTPNIGGKLRNGMARLDPVTGLADHDFDPNAVSSSNTLEVSTIAVQTNGQILVGGVFVHIGGEPRNQLARLDPVTGAADSFDPDPNSLVRTIAVQVDGKILVGGTFTTIGGQNRNRLARLDPNTGIPDSYDPNADALVYAIMLQADGKKVVAGSFTNIGGAARNRIARLEPNEGVADSFNPNADSSVLSLAIQPDGKILAGGEFTTIGGATRNHFARLTNDTGALQELTVTQTDLVWTRGGGSPQLRRVTFESSTDKVNYTFLGNGTQDGSTWSLTGLNLVNAQNLYIRARGHYPIGYRNASESIIDSLRNAFFNGATPTISVSNPAAQNEGSNGTTNLGFTVTLSSAYGQTVLVDYATANGTATAGSDYTSTTGTLTFDPGVTTQTIFVPITGDTTDEPNEGLELTLSSPTNATIADGTASAMILDDDTAPTLSISSPSQDEGNSGSANMNFTVTLSAVSGRTVTVNYGTSADTAAADSDYTTTGGTLTFSPGTTTQSISVPVAGDTEFESNETFTVTLSSPAHATLAGATGTGTIVNDDVAPAPSPIASPSPSATATPTPTATASATPSATPSPTAAPAGRALNISTRTLIGKGDDALIGGFIVTGSASKKVIIRAIGPSLVSEGNPLPGRLLDTTLELFNADGLVRENDDWRSDQEQEINDSTIPPGDDREAAIVVTLEPGNYTAVMRGKGETTGIGVVEVYDLDSGNPAQLAQISTRGDVKTGNNVMIGGFFLGGSAGNTRVLVRAIGPELKAQGVANALEDTTLELRSSDGNLLAANDDWRTDQEQAINDTTVPPADDREAAIVQDLPAGPYTAIVQGKNGTTGVALVEVYVLN